MGEMYKSSVHGIGEVVVDEGLGEGGVVNWGMVREETRRECIARGGTLERGVRVSATMRDVIRVRDYERLVPGLGGRRRM